MIRNKWFSYIILLAFFAGTILLVGVQYNSGNNTEKLVENNAILLKELRSSNHLREIDRDILGVESRIRASIATNDTSHLEGVDDKIDQVKNFLDSLSADNFNSYELTLIARLSELALDKKRTKEVLLHRYATLGNMDDTTSISNPRARRISNEITDITAQIYQRRQLQMTDLSQKSEEMGTKALWYDITLFSLLVFCGAIICFYIIRQFRKQNLLIEELHVAERQASVAAQAKENFLANMSHEIRTPLSGILGFTNLLQKRNLDETSKEFLNSIQHSGENLMNIINDILDLSKIEAGMMRITIGTFSINGLIHSVETLFEQRLQEKGLTISSTVDPFIPDTLTGDATRLTQILVNLIGNAIKFTQRGSISIEVYAKQVENDRITLGFKVRDTGIGIDKKKLEGVFERFNQGEEYITRNYGGTGLGLSIVKSLVTLQNGTIEVCSESGKGTTFNFCIPYGIAKEQLNIQASAKSDYFKDKSNMPLRILVVDDNSINQSLMKHLLLQWNVDFDIVSNGLEAIQSLENSTYDLVLMDIQMPKMDGYSATQHIREVLKSSIPIIAMTAHAMAGEREKCISRGMDEYISKPINEEELFTLISAIGLVNNRPTAIEKPTDVAPQFKSIDLTYMKSISRGNESFEKTVSEQFITNVPKHLQQLSTAYFGNDLKTTRAIAHDLKISVGMMGLLPVLEPKLDMLEELEEQNPAAEVALQDIESIIEAALIEVKLFYSSFPSL